MPRFASPDRFREFAPQLPAVAQVAVLGFDRFQVHCRADAPMPHLLAWVTYHFIWMDAATAASVACHTPHAGHPPIPDATRRGLRKLCIPRLRQGCGAASRARRCAMSEAPKAVFLSYASQDADAAKRVCESLRTAGVEVWFDQEGGLEHGDEWDAKIRRQIKECVLFLPIISATTQAREEGYFRIEWDLAAERAQGIAAGVAFILPIVIDGTRESEALVPDRFRKLQWTRLPGGQVSPEVLARFLKLWSHRTGVLRQSAAQAAADEKAGLGNPAQPRGEVTAPPRKAAGPGIFLGALAIIVGGAVAFLVFKPRRSPQEIAQLLAQVQALAESAEAKSAAAAKPASRPPAPVGPTAADSRSVAVLAFTNLSDDKENEYFSEGISEELLTVLQKIPGLHVAARTSAFSFKGKNATTQEIGQKLGVANLVDGSVRKAGNTMRITARLSRADTGEQLWSESYTRELKDVFALQEELALAIVGELRGQLAGGDSAAAVKAAVKGGTTNPEAYQQYLQGRFYSDRHSEKSVGEALAAYQRAVDLDPAFALGWAGLARAHVWYCEFSTELGREGFDAHLAKARAATDRALTLEPNLPEALLARSEIQLNVDFDWKGTAETLHTALALAPADPALVTAAGNLAGVYGDMARSTELFHQAVTLDPVNPAARSYLAFNLAMTGHFAEAQAEYPRVEELNPAAPWAFAGLGLSHLLEGKFEDAATIAQRDAAEWARLLIVSLARWSQKRIPEADAALARLTEVYADTAAYQIAEVHAYRGDKNRAFDWLERARRQHDGGLIELRVDPLLAKLLDDPRWPVFLRTMGLADDQLK